MKYVRRNPLRAAERGFTLTEVMVAITLSVFLLMGLFTILQQTRDTSTETTALSKLQDDERVAMTILTDTIQQAGYTPTANGGDQGMLLADGRFNYAGQIVTGGAGGTVGDRLTLRYVLGTTDNALDCLGRPNSSGADKVFIAVFDIEPFNGVNALACSPDAGNGVASQPIVNNVVNLTFQYAVNTTSATSATGSTSVGPNTEASHITGYGCPADTYFKTVDMSQYDWTNVCAVKVDITFLNPLYQPAGQANPTPGQPQYITFERVIAINSKAGVNTSVVSQT